MKINYNNLFIFGCAGLSIGIIWFKLAQWGMPLWCVGLGVIISLVIAILGISCFIISGMERDE